MKWMFFVVTLLTLQTIVKSQSSQSSTQPSSTGTSNSCVSYLDGACISQSDLDEIIASQEAAVQNQTMNLTCTANANKRQLSPSCACSKWPTDRIWKGWKGCFYVPNQRKCIHLDITDSDCTCVCGSDRKWKLKESRCADSNSCDGWNGVPADCENKGIPPKRDWFCGGSCP